MDKFEVISYISIAIIAISLFFIGTEVTGFAVTDNQTGIVNVTIQTSAALNFTVDVFDFGNGSVNGSGPNATLYSNGTVIDGSWTPVDGNLTLENIGNVNVSLNLSTNESVADFIGGSSQSFKALTNNSEPGSCTGSGSNVTFNGSYAEINLTPQTACEIFALEEGNDEITIDFELVIPNDASGNKSVGIVAIGTY